jgi:prepilin signal peptidase PulO-like enzyme (type II secretory pathway)
MIPEVTSLSGMATVIGSILAVAAGLVGGRLLAAGVGRLVEPRITAGSRAMLWAPVVAAAAALALWWWEVLCRGIVPEGADASFAMLATRCGLHGILFLLLAAATWIDLRHRIIPDAITVPGVLAGLAALAAWPDGLLPVIREVSRSFAPPLREADVLGFVGPLRGPWPKWLEPAPTLAGLAIAAVAFTVWWLVGTEPGVSDTRMGAWWRRLVAPRPLVAITGAAIVVTAWLVGGDHWRGLVSSLGGLAVSAGMVWLTRAGASRALGREAMGLGDVTLMAMVGAWLGWQPCVLACFLAVFIGLAHGVAQLVLHSETELPFGPSLCLGAALVVVGWRPLWGRTEPFFERPLEMAAVVTAVIVLTAVTLWAWHRLRPISTG